jgi:conserved domain protein
MEKEKLEKSIKSINEKYGIKKRWRAENEGYYYYIHSDYFLTVFAIDHHFTDDNNRYEAGNYFSTEKEAKEYMEYMKQKSLEWHEKRDNNE